MEWLKVQTKVNTNALMHSLKHEEMKHAKGKVTPNRKVTLIKLKEELKRKKFSIYVETQKCLQIGLRYEAK
mgnify:CR=1 FL=1